MATRRSFLKHVIAAGGVGVGIGAATARRPSAQAEQSDPRIAGFDHVAVPMRNTEAMVGFYRRLGFAVRESDRICSVHMAHQKINFHRPSLWESGTFDLRAPAAEPPCGDFCFVWDGDIPSLEARLADAGAEIILGPVGRQGGGAGGDAMGTSFYLRDPDQNLLEFIIY